MGSQSATYPALGTKRDASLRPNVLGRQRQGGGGGGGGVSSRVTRSESRTCQCSRGDNVERKSRDTSQFKQAESNNGDVSLSRRDEDENVVCSASARVDTTQKSDFSAWNKLSSGFVSTEDVSKRCRQVTPCCSKPNGVTATAETSLHTFKSHPQNTDMFPKNDTRRSQNFRISANGKPTVLAYRASSPRTSVQLPTNNRSSENSFLVNTLRNSRRVKIAIPKNRFTATVETWWRAPGKVLCDECGRLAVPLVRRQGQRMAKSSIGALCLLGCWPICFLPCFTAESEMVNLFCARCDNLLGTFGKRDGKLVRMTTSSTSSSSMLNFE